MIQTVQTWYEQGKVIAASLVTRLTALAVLILAFADDVAGWGLPDGVATPIVAWAVRAAALVLVVVKLVANLMPAPAGTKGVLLPSNVRLEQRITTYLGDDRGTSTTTIRGAQP